MVLANLNTKQYISHISVISIPATDRRIYQLRWATL